MPFERLELMIAQLSAMIATIHGDGKKTAKVADFLISENLQAAEKKTAGGFFEMEKLKRLNNFDFSFFKNKKVRK